MNGLFFIGIMMLLFFVCIGVADVVYSIVESYSDKHRYQRITFEKFKKLYEANPGKWELDKNVVSFVKIIDDQWKKHITFSFDLKDRCSYRKWKRAIEKQKRNERYSKELQEVISAIQADKE